MPHCRQRTSDRRAYAQIAMTFNLRHSRSHRDTDRVHTAAGPFTLVPYTGSAIEPVFSIDPQGRPPLACRKPMAEEIERRSIRYWARWSSIRTATLSRRGRDGGASLRNAWRWWGSGPSHASDRGARVDPIARCRDAGGARCRCSPGGGYRWLSCSIVSEADAPRRHTRPAFAWVSIRASFRVFSRCRSHGTGSFLMRGSGRCAAPPCARKA